MVEATRVMTVELTEDDLKEAIVEWTHRKFPMDSPSPWSALVEVEVGCTGFGPSERPTYKVKAKAKRNV